MNHLTYAQKLYDSGICPLPIALNGKKPTIGSWADFQRTFPPREDLAGWFRGGSKIAVVCGPVSCDLQCLDFDVAGAYQKFIKEASPEPRALMVRLRDGYSEKSPKGFHVLFGCEPSLPKKVVPAHYKVGERTLSSGRVVDDVRGVVEVLTGGQYVIVAPSKGYELESGGLSSIQTITPDQRTMLIDEMHRVLNEYTRPEVKQSPKPQKEYTGGKKSAIEFFNETTDLLSEIYNDGWSFHHELDGTIYLTRPGKPIEDGHSASFNHDGTGKFCNFSASMGEFPAEKYLDAFDYLRYRDWDGDRKQAAGWVRASNPAVFGEQSKVIPIRGDIVLADVIKPPPRREIPLPEGGLLLDWVNWLRERGRPYHEDQDELYLGAGLSFFGYCLSGNHRLEGYNSQTSLFITLISPTGTGKGTCFAAITDAIEECQIRKPNLRSHLSSGEALLSMFKDAEKPEAYLTLDEIGHLFEAAANKRGPMHSLAAHLLELYYAKKGMSKQYADSANNIEIKVAPELSLIGATTPAKFASAVLSDFITSGLANRILYFNGQGIMKARGVTKQGPIKPPLPASIIKKVIVWQNAGKGGLIRAPDSTDEQIRAATEALHETVLALELSDALGRVKENYMRLLAVVSACDGGAVSDASIDYTDRLMRYQIENVQGIVAAVSFRSGTVFEKDCDRTIEFMKKETALGSKISMTALINGPLRNGKTKREEVLEHLCDAGLITRRTEKAANNRFADFFELTGRRPGKR